MINENKRTKLRKSYFYLSVFLTALCLFWILMALLGMSPFGNKSILTQDLDIQYIDYFAYLHKVLHGQASISYSFNKSLGGSLIAWFGYYMACPLNLFVYFVEQIHLPYFLLGLISCKIALSATSMAYYLQHRYPNLTQGWNWALSIAFALCHYNMTQMSNLMWLDGVILLPVMALGTYYFVKDKKVGWLYWSLLLAVLFNWYTAYMNCLFMCLYFFYEYSLLENTFELKAFFKCFAQFIGLCGLAVMGAAILFLPVVLGQLQGKGMSDLHTLFAFVTNGQLLDVLRGLVMGSHGERTVVLFTGTLIHLLILAYFKTHEKRKAKWASILLLSILLASLLFRPLENVWNGFRQADSYWYRFAYVVHFYLVSLAARTIMLDGWQMLKGYKIGLGFLGGLIFLDAIHPFNSKVFWLTFCLILVTVCLLNSTHMSVQGLLVGLLFAELLLHGYLVNKNIYYSDIRDYQTYVAQQQKLIKEAQQAETGIFYRMDQTYNRGKSVNGLSAYYAENMAYLYSSLSHYSSTYDRAVAELMSKMGYGDLRIVTTYNEPILTSDSLFGVKYIFSNRPLAGYTALDWEPYNDKQSFLNPYALGLGILIPKQDKIQLDNRTQNPFIYQNQVYSALLGQTVNLFEPVDVEMNETDSGLIVTIPQQPTDNLLYGFGRFQEGNQPVQILVDGHYKTDYQTWLAHLVMNFGTTSQAHEIKFDHVNQLNDEDQLAFYQLNMTAFKKAFQQLKSQEAKLTHFDDGHIEFEVNSSDNQQLFTTIPYEKSWQAIVDGKVVQTQTFDDSLLTVPLSAGKQHVTLVYQAPSLLMGGGLSMVSLLAFFGICWWQKHHRHQKVCIDK